VIGGWFTILTAAIIIGFMISKSLDVLTQDYTISQKVNSKNEYQETEIYDIDSTRIDFMYQLEYDYANNEDVRLRP